MSLDSFASCDTLKISGREYEIYRLDKVAGYRRLPFCLKVLLENLLRHEDGASITAEQIRSLGAWDAQTDPSQEIQFTPARVIMQDFTGVPCVVDLATMREAMAALGGDPRKINPLAPAELVIDHSVIAELFGSDEAYRRNVQIEYQRNGERYQFLRWGQNAFDNFRVVPPGTGIIHQVNIEHLARVVMAAETGGRRQLYPDTCVGTDSHTTMVNGLGVLGWGVGGIEAEAAMLGQPVSMLIPRVVGFKLTGSISPGVTSTDVVLTITDMLRRHGVVGKFVEFYGRGVGSVPLSNRATIGNMSPEFGSTAAIFPVDEVTVDYLRFTGRSREKVEIVEAYSRLQGLWHDPEFEPEYSEYLELNLSTVVPSIAGPKRPQDRIKLSQVKEAFRQSLPAYLPKGGLTRSPVAVKIRDEQASIDNGAVTIAAITSCTNTSNPFVMVAAGLLAKNAYALGLKPKPWVKTTLAPGSRVVTSYYEKSGLKEPLEAMGFYLVGYGCTTCIGNSGPLIQEVSQAVQSHDLAVAAVLSGNRNFEGRINPDVKMNYLASPPLVVAYALAGTMDFDFESDALGKDQAGRPVYLRDIWPSNAQIEEVVKDSISADMFTEEYRKVFDGDDLWKAIETPEGETFEWAPSSTYVRKAPFFDGMQAKPDPVRDVLGARVLVKLGDSVTTDHISPAGSIKTDSPAGKYLLEHGVPQSDFNSYGSRRGNHEVMVRGTFANIRLKNQLLDGVEGGFTRDFTCPQAPQTTIYEASCNYLARGVELVVLAGKEYGSGSSRDWAAKGAALLGVKAVIAQSFERIHRSNLIGMGVIPLEFPAGQNADSLGLSGEESFDIVGITQLNTGKVPRTVQVRAAKPGGEKIEFEARIRIDTPKEADYYRNGGILQYVLRELAA